MVKLAAVAVLVVFLGSHVSELFDTWDNTFQTGNDIESSFVIAALTVGTALALISLTLLLFTRSWTFAVGTVSAAILDQFSALIAPTHSPPTIPLRI